MPFPSEDGLYPGGTPPGGSESFTETTFPSYGLYPSDGTYPGFELQEFNPTDYVSGSDAVSRQLVLSRVVAEFLTTSESLLAQPARLRIAADTVVGSDSVVRLTVLRRTATDTRTTTDSAKAQPLYRRMTESRVTTDAATRKVNKFRQGVETRTTTDVVTHHNAQVYPRTATETLTYSDTASAQVVPQGPPQGRPVVTITSVERIKLSHQPGFDRTLVHFTISKPVAYWTVRVNGTGPFDGFEADWWDGSGIGFGNGGFGHTPFGSRRGEVSGGTAEIDSHEVNLGDNDVAIYARDLSGAFSE